MQVDPDAFAERAAVRRRAAEEALTGSIRNLFSRNAAHGLLNSGVTITEAVAIGRAEALALASDLLVDYEHIKEGTCADAGILAVARETATGFATAMAPLLKLDVLKLPDSARSAADSLIRDAAVAVDEVFVRHVAGLPVAGVERKEPPKAPPTFAGLESWVRANPALWALGLLVAGAVLGAAATFLLGDS